MFKKLHRTRLKTFATDEHALQGKFALCYYCVINALAISNILLCCSLVVRKKINDEYRKYKNVTNQAAIEEVHVHV